MNEAEIKFSKAKKIIQEWIDKQGHERCWYYPDLFRKLAEIFEITPSIEPHLPPLEEFREGCKKYQTEEFRLSP